MLSKNQAKKAKQRAVQIVDAQKGLQYLLQELTSLVEQPNEIEQVLEELSSFIRKYSHDKDTSRFKNLIAFSKYWHFIKSSREKKVLHQVRKTQKRKLHWRVFEEEVLEMYHNGQSNEYIAKTIRAKGVKCNRESIRLFLIDFRKKEKQK